MVVKLNYANFTEIQNHIDKAKEYMGELIEMWETEFSNVKANFIDNNFIDDYYEKNMGNINNLSSVVGGADTGIATVTTSSPLTVARNKYNFTTHVDTAVSSAFNYLGINTAITGAMSYEKTAREKLKSLINECADGSNSCYTALDELNTKINNVSLALQLVLFKVAEFQSSYANLQTTADEMGSNLSLNISADGILMGINTTVEIDGQKYELTTSEAMNAMFTYTTTVMNAEIEAEYLKSEYGYEINYTDLVKNANAFMAKTIESNLYSHEFVLGYLPANSILPDVSKAYDATTGATKLSVDEIKSMLANNQSIGGEQALYGGLLGAAFLGAIGKGDGTTQDSPITDGGTTTDDSGSGSVYSGPGGYSSGGYSPGGSDQSDKDSDEKDPDKKDPEDTEDTETDTELEELIDEEIPEEELKPDLGETDYDQLAKDEYEFGNKVDDIIAHRNELLAEFEKAYETGDLSELEAKLKEYGYSDAEISEILNDRFKCYKALLEGDEKSILAEKAIALAAADGITDYQTHWTDRPNYNDLSSDGPSELLTLTSTDENICQIKTEVDTARQNYDAVLEETNKLIKEASDNKAKVLELKEQYNEKFSSDTSKWSKEATETYNEAVKAKEAADSKVTELKEQYEKEFGEDTSKWSEEATEKYKEAVKTKEENETKVTELRDKYNKEFKVDTKWSKEAIDEYNEAVKAYNESAGKVKEQLPKLEEAKQTYSDTVEKFNTAKEEFYKKLQDEGSSGSEEVITSDDTGAYDSNSADVGVTDNNGTSGIGIVDDQALIVQNDGTGLGTGDSSDNSGVRVSDNGIGFDN